MSTLAQSWLPQPYHQLGFTPMPMWDIPFPLTTDNAQYPACLQTTATASPLVGNQPSNYPSTFWPSDSPSSSQGPTSAAFPGVFTHGLSDHRISQVSSQQSHAQHTEKTTSPSAPAGESTTEFFDDSAPPPAKRRRGRPRKQLSFSSESGSLCSDALPADRHERRRVLERNRLAATKCRNRKRDETKDLEAQEQEAQERNRHLSATVAQLRTDLVDLKTQLLRHTDCQCTVIQKYIAHHAEKAVGELIESPSHISMPRRSSTKSDDVGDGHTLWFERLPSSMPQRNPIQAGTGFVDPYTTLPSQSHMVDTPPLAWPPEEQQHHHMHAMTGVVPTDRHALKQPQPVQQQGCWANWAQ
ncbi:uncharacterized protein J7T54_000417 [Emericellopsis cladophorae]|uniref:BZIP domain-containing protein n=1 Tax=Emericellopsis cladophorae TaxID=2686198 RepID=A0A9P9XWV7_9HYPO|nr:uncharacterized protein J7T54_000417 [Emericellopsis cladophorae]KAI6779319.1 hypothetical protein J7T54_000417 [Emericellopsis cladophorae]